MKHRIITLLLVSVASLSAFSIQADDRKKPNIDELVTQLSLNEGEAQQLKDLMQQHRQAKGEMRKKQHKSRDEKQQAKKQHREELLTVLSYEQLYQFEEYMSQFRRHHKKQKDL